MHIHRASTGAWLLAARVQPHAARVHGLVLQTPTATATRAICFGDRYAQVCWHSTASLLSLRFSPTHSQVVALDAPTPQLYHIASTPPLSQWVLAAAWLADGIVLGLSDNTVHRYTLQNNQVLLF